MPTSKWASSPRSGIPGTRAKSSFPWEGCMPPGPWRRSWASRISGCRWRRSGRGPPGSFGQHGTAMGSRPLPLSSDSRRGTLPSAEGDALVRDLVLELRVRGLDRLHGFGRTLFREEKDHVEAELRGLDRRSEHAIADAGTQTELPGDDDAGDIE